MPAGGTDLLYAVWGSSASNVFVVGEESVGNGGIIMHYDGKAWTNTSTANALECVYGNTASDIFSVGFGGTILHYDGGTWTTMAGGMTNDLSGVWEGEGSSSPVFVVGTEVAPLQ